MRRLVRSVGVFAAFACLPLFMDGAAHAELPAAFGAVDAKVVWVDFWASWCAPCRRSFPWMNSMHRKYAGEGLEIIAVNLDKERTLADDFLAEIPAEFRLHFDPSGSLAEAFGVEAMPSSFVLDASGKVLASHFGFKLAETDEYERAIRTALDNANRRNEANRETQ